MVAVVAPVGISSFAVAFDPRREGEPEIFDNPAAPNSLTVSSLVGGNDAVVVGMMGLKEEKIKGLKLEANTNKNNQRRKMANANCEY